MEYLWDKVEQYTLPFFPSLLLLLVVILALKLTARASAGKSSDRRFTEQALTTLIILIGLVGLLLVLPLESSTREQLLTLLGLLLTAVITLSSSTVIANAMAGVMLRSLRSYSPGDFIRVGDHFGRVTEQDLFHTEIQTEDRDLLTLPNLYLATNPVKVVHKTGTFVSAQVSLGYDVDYHLVETALIEAATDASLEEPFVYVMELGDFSVNYRVSGFLKEVKQILSVRSQLHKKMIDQLHSHNIEIISPAFMNQRAVENRIIPKRSSIQTDSVTGPNPESLIFDKADKAEQIKELQASYEALQQEIEQLKKSDEAGKEQKLEEKARGLELIQRALENLQEIRDA